MKKKATLFMLVLMFISTLLILSGTALSADQKFSDKGNKHDNGYGFGHRDKPPGCNVPEPISSALFALGGVGLGLYKKFKNKD